MARLQQYAMTWHPVRTDEDCLWDARISELIAYRREHGHVQVIFHVTFTTDSQCACMQGHQCLLLSALNVVPTGKVEYHHDFDDMELHDS